jgi:hypothetical protein
MYSINFSILSVVIFCASRGMVEEGGVGGGDRTTTTGTGGGMPEMGRRYIPYMAPSSFLSFMRYIYERCTTFFTSVD